MFKNHRTIEEEKVDIPENIIPYENNSNNTNYNINNEEQSHINESNNINITDVKQKFNHTSHSANKNLKKENFNEDIINTHSFKMLSQQTINNNNDFNSIKIENKINKTENKSRIKENKNLKVVTINKDDLYNVFILFQNLMSKYDNENENNIEYIKNKLFEFASVKKNKFFSETIECNDNYDENDNENIFDVQNYIPVYCKTENDLNINNTK